MTFYSLSTVEAEALPKLKLLWPSSKVSICVKEGMLCRTARVPPGRGLVSYRGTSNTLGGSEFKRVASFEDCQSFDLDTLS